MFPPGDVALHDRTFIDLCTARQLVGGGIGAKAYQPARGAG